MIKPMNPNNGDEIQNTGETLAYDEATKTWVKIDLPKTGADFANGVEF